MIVFGGRAEGDQFYGDAQALNLEGAPYWEELSGGAAGSGPGARYFHAAVLDPLAGRMIIFGGQCSSELWSDTWAHCGIR